MALKPPFSSLYYCSEVLRLLAMSPSPRSFLPMGIGGWYRRCLNLAMPHLGDAYARRRLLLAMPTSGDAYTLATPYLGDDSSGQFVDFLPWVPWGAPPYVDFWLWLWLWSTPGEGTVQNLRQNYIRNSSLTFNALLVICFTISKIQISKYFVVFKPVNHLKILLTENSKAKSCSKTKDLILKQHIQFLNQYYSFSYLRAMIMRTEKHTRIYIGSPKTELHPVSSHTWISLIHNNL